LRIAPPPRNRVRRGRSDRVTVLLLQSAVMRAFYALIIRSPSTGIPP